MLFLPCLLGRALPARARLPREGPSRKDAATSGLRANNVRPYSLYNAKSAFGADGPGGYGIRPYGAGAMLASTHSYRTDACGKAAGRACPAPTLCRARTARLCRSRTAPSSRRLVSGRRWGCRRRSGRSGNESREPGRSGRRPRQTGCPCRPARRRADRSVRGRQRRRPRCCPKGRRSSQRTGSRSARPRFAAPRRPMRRCSAAW